MSSSSPNGADADRKHALSPETTPLQPVRSPTDDKLDSSFPLAAQIPLQTFNLPKFPPEAAHLRSLTLTSDIKLDDYQDLVKGGQYELPDLPQSITHLTFELFSLGFPGRNPHFLGNIARALPNLKSVTFFSCLIDGLDDAARKDAEDFFDLTRVLKEVHVIDSFVRPGFWTKVGGIWSQRAKDAPTASSGVDGGGEMQVVEVSYTYRGHEDSDFLARVHGEELAKLVVPGVVGAGFGLVEEREDEMPPAKDDEGEAEKKESIAGGILPYASDSRASVAVKKHLSSNGGGAKSSFANLKVLNLALWTLTPEDIKGVLGAIQPPTTTTTDSQGGSGGGLIDLTLSILMTENWFEQLLSTFSSSPAAVKDLEGLDIIGVPAGSSSSSSTKKAAGGKASGPTKTDQAIDNIMNDGSKEWGTTSDPSNAESVKVLDHAQAQRLGEVCPRLGKVEMSILKAKKAGVALWVRGSAAGDWQQEKA